eukprot:gene6450-biopygen6492
MNDPTLVVHRSINELVYDTLGLGLHCGARLCRLRVDPRPILAKEQRLVRENRAADWTPTATTRKQQLWESLDPEFYAAIRVRYPRLIDLQHVSLVELSDLVASVYVSWSSSQAEQGGTTGTAASAVVPPGDELILKLFAKIERIENFIKSPRQGEGGHKFHEWDDCPLGGKKHAAGTTAAYCQPVADCTPEVLHTLALCQVFQSAADNGPAAFSAACTQYGAPAVLNDGASAGGVDISAYGFATGESEDSDDEGMYVEIELKQLRSEVAAATGVSMVQGSFAPPVSAVVAATTANDALSFSYSAPSGEFAGGIEEVPPPAGPRTIETDAHSMGTLLSDVVEPAVTRSSIVGCGVPPWGIGPHMPRWCYWRAS